MKAQAPIPDAMTQRSAVTRSASAQPASGGSSLTDSRPEAIAQLELADSVRNGPRMIAQRQQLHGMFGDIAPQATEASATVQRVAMVSAEAFENSKKQHDRDRKALAFAVEKGAETEPADELSLRLRNSCEWVLSGRLHLIALTRTADSEFRKKEKGENTYFPLLSAADEDVVHGGPKYYVNDVDNWANVFAYDDATRGGSAGNMIYVFNASEDPQEISTTLRHEVQHAADHHDEEVKTPLVTFKTEYRAHYYQGTFGESTEETVKRMGHTWNKRQYAVVRQIMKNYPEIVEAWDRNQGGFQEEVVKYVNPDTEAINKYNSARIENFYLSVAQVKPDKLDYPYRLKKFKEEVQSNAFALDEMDIKYLKSPSGKVLRDRILSAIKPDDQDEIKGLLSEMVGGKKVSKVKPVTVSKAREESKEERIEPSRSKSSVEKAPEKEKVLKPPRVTVKEEEPKIVSPSVKPSTTKSQREDRSREKRPKVRPTVGKVEAVSRNANLRESATLRGDDKEEIATLPANTRVTIPLPEKKLTFKLGGLLRLGGLLSSEKEHTWVETVQGEGWVRSEAI